MSLILAAALVFTPPAGVTNPAVTQANIHTTICVKNWTKTIRPPASYTNKLKAITLAGRAEPALYELDHLIPLELGGAPKDARNLWPEIWPEAHLKDRLENRLHLLVCSSVNPLPLAEAQRAIATDWRAAYRKYVEGR